MRVTVLGASGMLGSTLVPFLRAREFEVCTHGRSCDNQFRGDLGSRAETDRLLEAVDPSAIVNLVGLSDVEHCESAPNEAFRANVRTVENVAAWINRRRRPCHLIHISTDQVYDDPGPHTEDDVRLTNYYAFSKYAGELVAASVASTVVRTNFFGLSRCGKRTSLTDWLSRSLVSGRSIQVFDDVFFSPVTMSTLCTMIAAILCKRPEGTFNVGSHDGMSKAEFAFAFAAAASLPVDRMTRASVAQVTFLKAYRPKDMRMDTTKFEAGTGIVLPSLRDEIQRTAEEYREAA